MRDGLGVGLADELASLFGQPLTQLAKILDDAVVNDRNDIGGVRMSVVFVRSAVGRPTGMTDTDIAPKWFAIEPRFKRAQLAFCATTTECAVVERSNAGRVITSVFEAFKGVDQLLCNRFCSQEFRRFRTSVWMAPLPVTYRLAAQGRLTEITTRFARVTLPCKLRIFCVSFRPGSCPRP